MKKALASMVIFVLLSCSQPIYSQTAVGKFAAHQRHSVRALGGLNLDGNFVSMNYFKPMARMNYCPLLLSINKSFGYGIDRDNIPYARKPDGTKVRYLGFSLDHFTLQIANDRPVGEVEFIRFRAGGTVTRFKVDDAKLLVRTTANSDKNGVPEIRLDLEYKSDKVTLKTDESSPEGRRNWRRSQRS